MNNWELKAIAILIMLGLIAVGVAYCQMEAGGGIGEDATLLLSAILMLVGSIAALVTGVILLLEAFRQDVLKGLLFLFLPFYSIYFAIMLYNGEHKGWVLAGWLGGSVIAGIGLSIFYIDALNAIFY